MGLFPISLPLQVRAATPDAGAPSDASSSTSTPSTGSSTPPPTALHCGEGQSTFRYRVSIVNPDHTYTRQPEAAPVCRRTDQAPDDALCPTDHRLVTFTPGEGGNAAHLLCEPRSPSGSSSPSPSGATGSSGSTASTGTSTTASSTTSSAASTDPNAQTLAGRLWATFGYGWRGYGNHRDDPHEGVVFSLGLGIPRLNMGTPVTPNNFYLEPFIVYRHEETGRNIPVTFGPTPRSSATVDALGLGVFLGWRPHQWFEMALGADVGAGHLSARADPTGEMSGLLVGNSGRSLALFVSADQWGVDLNARLRLGIPEQRIGCSPVAIGGGAEGLIGYNSWSIRPDWASEADRALAVDSIHGSLQFYLRATIDGGAACSSSTSSSSGSSGSSGSGSTGDAGASTPPADASTDSPSAPATTGDAGAATDAATGDAARGDASADGSSSDASSSRGGADGGAPRDASTGSPDAGRPADARR